jgi:amino acid adenylation domain-containing protein
MSSSAYADILKRIEAALDAARVVFSRFRLGEVEAEYKIGHDPVTEADRAIDEVLRRHLLREGEGWLSEESVDDESRLSKSRVWIVDPLDGTREFVAGIPEFCVSIGFVENGRPVAGGIYNPATDEMMLGAIDSGVWYNGQPARCSQRTALQGSLVLASRSEIKRGEWKQFEGGPLEIRAMGSVAYKLGLVAVGRADLTFTLTPKHEWDVAAGAALVLSGGGIVTTPDNSELRCNQKNPLIPGLIGCGPNLNKELIAYLKSRPNLAQSQQNAQKDSQDSPRGIPLSSTQERLWVLDQLHPRNPAQNVPCGLRLTGLVPQGAVQAALDAVVLRHEILRTEFRVMEGAPEQVVLPSARIALNTVSLVHCAPLEREAEVLRLARQEMQNPFDLSSGPLLRAVLFHLTDAEHVLVVICNRIVCDEASLQLLLTEVNSLYQAQISEKSHAVPKLPAQYHEAAARDVVPSSTDLAFWKQYLEGAPSSIDLPADRPRPPLQTFRGDKQRMSIEPWLLERLRTVTQSHGATLFGTLLAAFGVLLSRYSRQEDLVVGTRVSGRGRPELESVIGPLENMLAFRIDASGEPCFAHFVDRVHQSSQAAFSHQEIPFETVLKQLRLDRDMSRHPLFQVIFTMKDSAVAGRAPTQPGVSLLEFENPAEEFDLSVEFALNDNGLDATFGYNTDLFDSGTIGRMMGHFQSLLAAGAENPSIKISRLPLLSEAERQRLLMEWNDTAVAYPREATVHQLFEAQVNRSSGSIAVVCRDKRLTYDELNSRANQLARYLQKRGVVPGDLVGICVDRSVDMLVALLGVLKAGGAYVPLDPAFPTERLAQILQDSNVRVLLAQRHLLSVLPVQQAKPVFLDTPEIALESSENPASRASARDLAYVIFTSGSTGRPKGVQIEHREVVNFLESMAREPGLVADDVLVAVTTLSFDIAGLELFLPLVRGARVVIADREVAVDGRALGRLLETSGATVMQATPATWRMLFERGWAGRKGMKILCGGEQMPADLAKQLIPCCSSLWNMYGPTETTIWSTLYKVSSAENPTPIGRPIANTRVYLLDGNLKPVPIGVPGELFIAGDGVARGYLNRPELTAERFTSDPFGGDETARMYRTGDLCRWRTDGNIEYLGRMDFQVKVRGFRIELGEIEAVLSECPGVRQAAVMVREDTQGDKRLVAYLIPTQRELHTEDIKRSLREKLPEYMMPSHFVSLEKFPMTTNGKLDRKALPAPLLERGVQTMVPPRNELEAKLAALFASVLKVPSVGVTDNFFDLGGHSLLAGRLLAQVHEQLGKQAPLSALFRGATVEALAKFLADDGHASTEPIALNVQAGDGSRLPFFAIVPPGEESIGYAMLARHMGPEQTVYKIQGHAPVLNGSRPPTQEELQTLTTEYVAAIRSVRPHGPYCLGGLCDGTHISEQIVLSLESEGEEVALFAIFDTWVMQHSQRRWLWRIDYYRQRLQNINKMSLAERLASYRRVAEKKVLIASGRQPARTDWQERYWPKNFTPPRFRAPVVLFKRPKQQFYYINDPEMGWGRRSEGGVEIHEIDFHHKEILREPHVRQFGFELAECISRVSRRILKPEQSTESQPVLSAVSVQQFRQGS